MFTSGSSIIPISPSEDTLVFKNVVGRDMIRILKCIYMCSAGWGGIFYACVCCVCDCTCVTGTICPAGDSTVY